MANVYPLDRLGTYRKTDRDPKPFDGSDDVTVLPEDDNVQVYDPNSGTSQLSLPDGDVVISFGPPDPVRKETEDFNDNLAEELSQEQLAIIADRLLQGIEQDEQSRAAWLENMSAGLSLLGLETKTPRGASVAGTTPAEGVSTVDHPLLLEAVLRFQATARGELLPSDGPVKVRNDGEGNALATKLADALEKDLNFYLTKVAKEYVPDTDRMLLQLGFAGIAFKKGYHCPIKRRPVLESIDAKDLIVSNGATNIDGAGRVTHRILMRPSVLKRMQLLGAYLNYDLPPMGLQPLKNPVDAKIDEIQGLAPPTYQEPEDQDRELYECYCELDIPGFEHEFEGKVSGLPLPYKVTIDKEARRILEIRRNWDEDDEFCLPLNRIIAYTFIPGLGFYGIGLVNVLGNATKAVTAAWRLMIDAGMFSNFPGFLYLKSLAKQLTNQFRVAPGSGMAIDTVGQDIRSAIMPLPYKDPSAVFIQLIDNIATTAQRVGGIGELQVGEGKQDAPVGTTLAMLEQATKLMSGVHKRCHEAQAQEFDILKSLLMEDPEALWRHNKKSKVLAMLTAELGQEGQIVTQQQEESDERRKAKFLLALQDCELTPRADPNTASQTERYLKVVALKQLAQTNPNIDMNKVDERALAVMGIDDAAELFVPPPPPGMQKPAPEELTAQATIMAAQARMMDAQTKAQDVALKAAQADKTQQSNAMLKREEIQSREKIAIIGVAKDLVFKDADRKQAEGVALRDIQKVDGDRKHAFALANLGHQANAHKGLVAGQQSMMQQERQFQHDKEQKALDRYHKSMEGLAARSTNQSQFDAKMKADEKKAKAKPKPAARKAKKP